MAVFLCVGVWLVKQPSPWPKMKSGTAEDAVRVWYFDMGQGNASLVESEGQYMLIDTGNYEDVHTLKELLAKVGVEKLDFVVATHPHADHIGSLATVIREYEIGTLLMPGVETDTKTYQVAVEAARKKQQSIEHPQPGSIYTLGQVEFQVLSPNSREYENLNDYSITIRLSCQDTEFLWTGDAESLAEEEMVQSGLELEAEVYHVGHHGSNTSSSWEFLKEVDPEYAVISCGADNDYGYPHEEVLERLERLDVKVLTTADQGSIEVRCRGNELQWHTHWDADLK